jgi:hypothetical protein
LLTVERCNPKQVRVRPFDQKMVVVGQETVGLAKPVISLINLLKGLEEILAVQIVFEDHLLIVTTRCNMMHDSRIFYLKWKGHGRNLA